MGAPQRLRMAEWLMVHDLEGTFRLDSNQRGEDFPSAREIVLPPSRKSLLLWTQLDEVRCGRPSACT